MGNSVEDTIRRMNEHRMAQMNRTWNLDEAGKPVMGNGSSGSASEGQDAVTQGINKLASMLGGGKKKTDSNDQPVADKATAPPPPPAAVAAPATNDTDNTPTIAQTNNGFAGSMAKPKTQPTPPSPVPDEPSIAAKRNSADPTLASRAADYITAKAGKVAGDISGGLSDLTNGLYTAGSTAKAALTGSQAAATPATTVPTTTVPPSAPLPPPRPAPAAPANVPLPPRRPSPTMSKAAAIPTTKTSSVTPASVNKPQQPTLNIPQQKMGYRSGRGGVWVNSEEKKETTPMTESSLVASFLALQGMKAENMFEAAKRMAKKCPTCGKLLAECTCAPVKEETEETIVERNKENKFKKDLHVVKKGIEASRDQNFVKFHQDHSENSDHFRDIGKKAIQNWKRSGRFVTKEEVEPIEEKNWIKGAIKHPGALTKAAKAAGETNSEYEHEHEHDSGKAGQRSRLALTLKKMHHEEVEPIEEKIKTKADRYAEFIGKTKAKEGLKKVMSGPSTSTPKSDVKEETIEEAKKDANKTASGYEIYHPSYSGAVDHALKHHEETKGIRVHEEDRWRHVGSGMGKPAAGETRIHNIPGHDKNENAHVVHIQIHNRGGNGTKPYELNTYSSKIPHGKKISEAVEELDELSRRTMANYIAKAHVSGTKAAADAENAFKNKNRPKMYKANLTGEKRETGINMATRKLAREDVEEFDEANRKIFVTGKDNELKYGVQYPSKRQALKAINKSGGIGSDEKALYGKNPKGPTGDISHFKDVSHKLRKEDVAFTEAELAHFAKIAGEE